MKQSYINATITICLILGCFFNSAAAVRRSDVDAALDFDLEDDTAAVRKAGTNSSLDFQEGNAALCDKDIVASTCHLLNGSHTTGYTGSKYLQKLLAASTESVEHLWSVLELQSLSSYQDDSGFQVTCHELCSKVVDFLQEMDNCPPQSNLGCYLGADGQNVCDLDLRTKAVTKAADFEGNLPDLHDRKFIELTGSESPEMKALDENPLDYDNIFVLVQRIANLFHIYPRNINVDEVDRVDEVDGMNNETSLLQSKEKDIHCGHCFGEISCIKYWSCRTCPHCSATTTTRPMDFECGHCTGEFSCIQFRSCKTCPQCSTTHYHHAGSTLPPHPHPQPIHTTTTTTTRPQWRVHMEKLNLKAQAYVVRAIKRFQQHDTEIHIKKWFGRQAYTNAHQRARVQKILNSVNNMLGNVEYVYPGDECEKNTYAYVYPKGGLGYTKNSRGKFIFYLCKQQMIAEESVQIETLVHEGSHHATAYTDDVDFHGQTAYGRNMCMQLAREDPNKALDNADSFCYYVQDITDTNY
eukprot:TRINITY_DN720_c0_g1_i2.p1 TRINITY_DN720_c0_g1~~TRINITY_DN720_c0_g1_i2.p1  ORF type:complete len:524 (-),score=71.85 TRINITY_DN720_c0_g1_i2:278-1849(-)